MKERILRIEEAIPGKLYSFNFSFNAFKESYEGEFSEIRVHACPNLDSWNKNINYFIDEVLDKSSNNLFIFLAFQCVNCKGKLPAPLCKDSGHELTFYILHNKQIKRVQLWGTSAYAKARLLKEII